MKWKGARNKKKKNTVINRKLHPLKFWKNLAQGGEYQIKLLYHLKIISKFLDFMLDKHSPVEGINNKSTYRLGS